MGGFKNNFNPDFNARDVIAIMGAHSLGRVHPVAPLDAYSWTRTQDALLNHQYYRNIVNKPELMLVGGQWKLQGDIGNEITEWGQWWLAGWGGKPGRAHWKPVKGLRKWGAPFHWTHVFEHGPVCYKEKGGLWKNRGAAVEKAQRLAGKAWKGLGDIKGGSSDKFKRDQCCEKLMNNQREDKDCLTWTANDELMFSVDMASIGSSRGLGMVGHMGVQACRTTTIGAKKTMKRGSVIIGPPRAVVVLR